MYDYRKLRVWQKSHNLVLNAYNIIASFPSRERYNLTDQILRASTSVPTNIAEGCGRQTHKEFLRYLYIASGSIHELEYLIFLAYELGYINEDPNKEICFQISEVKKMLSGLIAATAKRIEKT